MDQRTAEKSAAIYTERIQFPKDGPPGAGARDKHGGGKERKTQKGPFNS